MINLIQQPQKYIPANNAVIFQTESDDTNIQFFQVQLLADDGTIMENLRLYTSPDYRTGSYIDLSSILSNTVKYQLLPSNNLLESVPDLERGYRLAFLEKLYDNGSIIDGTGFTTGNYHCWNALIDKASFTEYDFKNYVVNATGNTAQFLTNKPALSAIYRNSTEYLYFLNDGLNGNITIKFYNKNNVVIGTHNLSLSAHTTGATRIDISPSTLNTAFSISLADNEFGDMFDVPFGSNYSINNSNYFTVSVTDLSGVTKSQTRTYVLKDYKCNVQPVQILFANQLGGYDSINFFNPKEQIDVTKTSMAKNPFELKNDVYSDNLNGVYHDETEVINVSSTSTYTIISDVLRDDESIWLKELIKAPKVYVKLSDGAFYPIAVTNLNYPVQHRKYNSSLIRLTLSFTITDTGINLVI